MRCPAWPGVHHLFQVNLFTTGHLTARLPRGWLPMGDMTALLEASMRRRGYEVQFLPLQSAVSHFAAQNIFRNLPAPNTTAFQLIIRVRRRLAALLEQVSVTQACHGSPQPAMSTSRLRDFLVY